MKICHGKRKNPSQRIVKKIKQKDNGVSLILNKISSECPDPSYLRTLIMDVTEPGSLGINLQLNPEGSIQNFYDIGLNKPRAVMKLLQIFKLKEVN